MGCGVRYGILTLQMTWQRDTFCVLRNQVLPKSGYPGYLQRTGTETHEPRMTHDSMITHDPYACNEPGSKHAKFSPTGKGRSLKGMGMGFN